MKISDEAVEAAAKQMALDDGNQFDWTMYQHGARAALKAAAPHIIAHAAKHLADGMRSWAGVDEIAYVQGFAEAATETSNL